MPPVDLATLERRLGKRGFGLDDAQLHPCPTCAAQAVRRYILKRNRLGGRDIAYCMACGGARSWTSGAGFESRVEDVGFDLEQFLA